MQAAQPVHRPEVTTSWYRWAQWSFSGGTALTLLRDLGGRHETPGVLAVVGEGVGPPGQGGITQIVADLAEFGSRPLPAQLAHVVEQRAVHPEGRDLPEEHGKIALLGQPTGQAGGPPDLPPDVGVPFLHRVGDGFQMDVVSFYCPAREL